MFQKKSKLTTAIEKADKYTSWWVRLFHSFDGEHAKCYTCGKILPIVKIQNGHCFSRARWELRYEPDNMRPQCVYCNKHLKGNIPIYMQNLRREIGAERLDEMEIISKQYNKRPPIEQFEEIATKFRLLYNELKKCKLNS